LQLQTALELDLTQHLTSEIKSRQHFEVAMSRETSNLQQTLENRLSHHDLVSKDLQAFRLELDKEFKSRFQQFDRRFQEEHHKFKNLSKVVLSTNTSDSERAERILNRPIGDRVECRLEKEAEFQNITILEEQTDSGDAGAMDGVVTTSKENVRRRIARWEAREMNDHGATTEHTECAFQEDMSCSWDQLKLIDHDQIIEQTDSTLEEGLVCFVGSNMNT